MRKIFSELFRYHLDVPGQSISMLTCFMLAYSEPAEVNLAMEKSGTDWNNDVPGCLGVQIPQSSAAFCVLVQTGEFVSILESRLQLPRSLAALSYGVGILKTNNRDICLASFFSSKVPHCAVVLALLTRYFMRFPA